MLAYLGIDALRRGFKAKIYSYDITLFDPTWSTLSSAGLIAALKAQETAKKDPRISLYTTPHIDFLEQGGEVLFNTLTPGLLNGFFERGVPLLSGVSETWLSKCEREYTGPNGESVYDAVKGYPLGHFIVLHGMDNEHNLCGADPSYQNDIVEDSNYYTIPYGLYTQALMLGILTTDANFLVISKD